MVSLAAIETCRLDEENRDGHRVNEKSTGVGEQILASGVENHEHQRGKECALQAAKPSDCHHDQEEHEVENRKARRKAKQLDGKAATEGGKPRPHGEGKREEPIDIDTDRFRHATVVD